MARGPSWATVPFICSNCRTALPLRPVFAANTSSARRYATSRPRVGTTDEILAKNAPTGQFDISASNQSILDALKGGSVAGVNDPYIQARLRYTPPHRIHVYATKHNTHMTLTEPPAKKEKRDEKDAYKPAEPNKTVMTITTGMIGFKKHHRSSYDAAFQLASYFLKQIQERALLKDIKEVEVVLRGFGPGREASTKVLLGQEGRLIRPKIVAVTDATRLKFGGSRSPNPRRLG